MNFKKIFQAFTGYAGSSENPEKVSARFMGIVVGLASQFAPIVSTFFSVDIQIYVNQVEPIVLLVACLMWFYGAVKACWQAAKASPIVGAYLR